MKQTALAVLGSLPGIAQSAWQQRSGETDDEYAAFTRWLNAGMRRGAPPEPWARVAQTQDWASRAAAFESTAALVRDGGSVEGQTVDALKVFVALEARKLLMLSQTSEGAITSVPDLIKIVGLLQNLAEKAAAGGGRVAGNTAAKKVDLSQYSDEEIEIMLKAQDISRRKNGGA